MGDPSVNRVLDMQSPSGTLQSAGSSSGSGSKKSRVVDLESPDLDSSGSADKKRRVVVDLDDIDSEPEDEAGKYNQELVQVKIEPED